MYSVEAALTHTETILVAGIETMFNGIAMVTTTDKVVTVAGNTKIQIVVKDTEDSC